MNPPSPQTASTRRSGWISERRDRRGQPRPHRRQRIVEQQRVGDAGAVVAGEPDLVHAVVECNDAIGRDDLADIVHDALRRQRKPRLLATFRKPRQNPLAQAEQRSRVGKLALQAVGQRRKAQADVAEDLGLRKIHLLHRRRRRADMDHLRPVMAHQERRLFDGVVADREDQIGAIDRLVNPVPLRQRCRTHVKIRAGIDGALPHLGIEEWNFRPPHERRQRLGKLRTARGRPQHHERPLGGDDHRRGAFDRGGRRNRKFDDVRRDQVGIRLVGRDILGQFEMDWPRALLLRHPEGVAHQGRNARRRDDSASPFW